MALAMSFGSQAQAQGLNHEVLRLHGEMQGATAPTALELRREASAAIVQRASEMKSLIEKSPAQALSMALSADLTADLAAKFPEAAGQLESQGTWQGPAEYSFEDY